MRYLAILFTTLFLVACSVAPVARSPSQLQAVAMNPPVEFLLTKSATDFHTQHPLYPVHFRDVRVGHVFTPSGAVQYILCGQFLPTHENGKAEWGFFVTIDTAGGPNGYDLLLGGEVPSLCQETSVVWDSKDDLSTGLQSKFDDLN